MIDKMKARIGWHNARQRKNRGGKWEARWADEAGRVHGRMFLTKVQAQKFAWDAANGIVNTTLGLVAPKKSLEEARDSFLGRSLNPKTTALNERRVNEFLVALPAIALTLKQAPIRFTGQVTNEVIHAFDKVLIAQGCNPGGRQHVLKIVRAFCRYCIDNQWLSKNPFDKFVMPSTDFEGCYVNPEEFDRLCATSNQYPQVDFWLDKAFRLGRETMLRISQVWEIAPMHFKAPDQLWVRGIKGQKGLWMTLRPMAVDIVTGLLQGRAADERFFSYWGSVESMRNSVHDKIRRARIKPRLIGGRVVYPRFHDVCKVSRVTELDARGIGLGAIAAISNTTKKTLAAHYIKADRAQAYRDYQKLDLEPAPTKPLSSGSDLKPAEGNLLPTGSGWTERGPNQGPNGTEKRPQAPVDASNANIKNDSISPQIPNV